MKPIATQFNMHQAIFDAITNPKPRPHHIPVTFSNELYLVPVYNMTKEDRQDFEDQMEQEGRDLENENE